MYFIVMSIFVGLQQNEDHEFRCSHGKITTNEIKNYSLSPELHKALRGAIRSRGRWGKKKKT